MFSSSALQYSYFDGKRALLFIFLMLIIEWVQRDKEHALQLADNKFFQFRTIRWATYYLLIVAIVFFAGGNQTFIYFQF